MKKKNGALRQPKMGKNLGIAELEQVITNPAPEQQEQDVRAVFHTMMALPNWRERIHEMSGIVSVISTQEKFPDGWVHREKKDGTLEIAWVEFETVASRFKEHQKEYKDYLSAHPIICICWKDDGEDYPGSVPEEIDVLPLKDMIEGKSIEAKEEWTEEQKAKRSFLDYVSREFKKRCPAARIGQGGKAHQQVRVGRSGEHFEWWVSPKWGLQVAYHMEHFGHPEKNKKVWDELGAHKQGIEKAVGESLVWRKISDKWYAIAMEKPYTNYAGQKEWAVDAMVRLYNAMKPVLDKLKK